jgi:hypothetical protein
MVGFAVAQNENAGRRDGRTQMGRNLVGEPKKTAISREIMPADSS